jgi:hypothetical protein
MEAKEGSAPRVVPLMCRWGVQRVKVMLVILFVDYMMNFSYFYVSQHKTTTGDGGSPPSRMG